MASKTITANCNTNGQISAASSNTNIATVSVNNKTITVNPTGGGSCTVTVSAGNDPNYTTPQPVTCNVTVKTKAMYNGLDIQEIVRAGKGSSMLAVGDRWPVKMKGKVGNVDIYERVYYVCLIGLNHNTTIETYGKFNAHFKFPYDSDGKQLAFDCFPLNTTNTTPNGWPYCTGCSEIMQEFKVLLPLEWLNAISSVHKICMYDTTPVDMFDDLWPLSPWEVFGRNPYNEGEGEWCQQYQYYKNGNSFVHYVWPRSNVRPGEISWVWTRSQTGDRFVVISGDGMNLRPAVPSEQLGFAPAFSIH